ncbi:hypothetical protein [Paenibacillus assamensis]|uniref:hypothetical protein n=1 Tax=Paenibacillus assamensis TaxID=311244 RepID=UPI00040C3D41|nr:hypothetical protein [Paenibacillus assamensis]
MNPKLRRLIIQLTLITSLILLILVIIFFASKNEDIRSFSLNLITELVGFVIIVFILERILNKYRELEGLEKMNFVASQFNKVFQGYVNTLADIYKATSTEATDEIFKDLKKLFNEDFFKQLDNFDIDSHGPVIDKVEKINDEFKFHFKPWHEVLINRFEEHEKMMESYFEKYSAWMNNDMMKMYSGVLDIKISNSIRAHKRYEQLRLEEQEEGFVKYRISVSCGYHIFALANTLITIDEYNRSAFSSVEQIAVNKNLWANHIAPGIGESLISDEDEKNYIPRGLMDYSKLSKF